MSDTVKRYQPSAEKEYGDRHEVMEQEERGDYVLHADYAKLEAERDRFRDLVIRAAALQRQHYGHGTNLHLDMIGWAEEARAALSPHAPTGAQGAGGHDLSPQAQAIAVERGRLYERRLAEGMTPSTREDLDSI